MYSLKLSLFLNKLAGFKRTDAWRKQSTRQSRLWNNWEDKTKLSFEQRDPSDLRCWSSSLLDVHNPVSLFFGFFFSGLRLIWFISAWGGGVSNNGLTQNRLAQYLWQGMHAEKKTKKTVIGRTHFKLHANPSKAGTERWYANPRGDIFNCRFNLMRVLVALKIVSVSKPELWSALARPQSSRTLQLLNRFCQIWTQGSNYFVTQLQCNQN